MTTKHLYSNKCKCLQCVTGREYVENKTFADKFWSNIIEILPFLINLPWISPSLRRFFIVEYSENIKWVKTPTDEESKLVIEIWLGSISNIKNPTEEIQMYAVKKDPLNILYIERPTEEVLMYVVSQNPNVWTYVSSINVNHLSPEAIDKIHMIHKVKWEL